MKSKKWLIGLALVAIVFSVTSAWGKARLNQQAPDFTLTAANGQKKSLSDYKGKIVVLEWTNFGCPFVKKHYNSKNMPKLQQKYQKKGVAWLTICSSAANRQGHMQGKKLQKKMDQMGFKGTAYLNDSSGKVGKLYGARNTPHMFIINKNGKLVYKGAIDSIRSTSQADVKKATNYVAQALDELLDGKKVSKKYTRAYGCGVKYEMK
jgi:peroxiredoxin